MFQLVTPHPLLLLLKVHMIKGPVFDMPFWLALECLEVQWLQRKNCTGCKQQGICHHQMTLFLVTKNLIFQNPRSGMFEQSRDRRNVYYHTWKTCIAPHFRDFDPSKHIFVSPDKTKLIHRETMIFRRQL